MHSNARGLFIFDGSTNHGPFAEDSLVVSKMNVNRGGKVPAMRDTSFTTSEGTVVQQRMVGNDSKPKGLKLVLEERNLWLNGLRQKCKLNPPTVPTPTCCACHRLGAQPDFQNQKSILYEALEGTGHFCDFLPKFHCELAPIENYWGFAKQWTRSRCDYSIQALRKTVPKSLDAVPLSSISKYFRRAHHLIQACDQGLSYTLAMFAHKTYESHRRLPPNQMDAIDDEINARHTSEEQV
mmetsp:Transcript_24550/g.36028  ORF Transcript_24550/g.36028 Transcript_24550/m.36028 type:complete len:238 (-) Transcript_24550:1216-1929(-)